MPCDVIFLARRRHVPSIRYDRGRARRARHDGRFGADVLKGKGSGVLRKIAGLLKPSVCSLGYALFLAVNATGIWGGVFPFLPFEIQTGERLFWFYLAQSLMLFLTFAAAGVGSVVRSLARWKSSARVIVASAVYFAGWACLIIGMYAPGAFVELLVVFGGVFLGAGAGLFYLLWQRMFAGQGELAGLRDLIVGFVYAGVIYAALYLIPRAVTAYLIPLVFLPLFALAVILGNRRGDYTQPMFADVPRENLRVYRRALLSMWRGALCMGALALCAGLVRSVAIERPEIGTSVNLLSMMALIVVALAMLLLWQLKGVRMNLTKLYQIVFPVIISAFVLVPFAGGPYVRWLAAGLFALYSVGLMLTMVQCMQMSRDRGVNPTFAFGFFGGIVYGLHDIGFIVGSLVGRIPFSGGSPALTMAVLAIYLLALMFFITVVNFKRTAAKLLYGDTIELITPVEGMPVRDARSSQSPVAAGAKDKAGGSAASTARVSSTPLPAHDAHEREFKDRLDKQIAALQQMYRLSDRETEVVGLIVHGNTVPRVAEKLFISENTVRTHTKRIYNKLGVHKKQELIELVESF